MYQYHCINSEACFSSKTLKMQSFLVCVCVHIKGGEQDAKKIIFTASHSGKLKLAFTSPDVISTSPKSFLTSRIDFTVLPLFKFRKKTSLAGQAS